MDAKPKTVKVDSMSAMGPTEPTSKPVAPINPTCKACEKKAAKDGLVVNCTGCKTKVVRDVPGVENYSQTKRAALALLGPKARVWSGEPQRPPVSIGFEVNPGRHVIGFGDTFQEALEKAVEANRL